MDAARERKRPTLHGLAVQGCARSRACCCSSGFARSLRCAPEAEPTTCFKIREVLGVSMCTEKIDRVGKPLRAGPQR